MTRRAAFTPAQEARIAEIAMEMVIAASRAQAALAAGQVIDRIRLSPREVEEFLSTSSCSAHG